jgi:hypothetical protein
LYLRVRVAMLVVRAASVMFAASLRHERHLRGRSFRRANGRWRTQAPGGPPRLLRPASRRAPSRAGSTS